MKMLLLASFRGFNCMALHGAEAQDTLNIVLYEKGSKIALSKRSKQNKIGISAKNHQN